MTTYLNTSVQLHRVEIPCENDKYIWLRLVYPIEVSATMWDQFSPDDDIVLIFSPRLQKDDLTFGPTQSQLIYWQSRLVDAGFFINSIESNKEWRVSMRWDKFREAVKWLSSGLHRLAYDIAPPYDPDAPLF